MATEEEIEDPGMENSVDEKFAVDSKYQECQLEVEALKSDNYVLGSDNGSLMNELQSSKQNPVAVVSNNSGSSNDQVGLITKEDGLQENADFSTDELSWSNRTEKLDRLCEVLMEERDAATKSLREKEAELNRLRQRAVQSEQEKGKLRNQLLQALERTEEKEKRLTLLEDENAKLKTDVERLQRIILELQTKDRDGKTKVDSRTNQGTAEGIEGSADMKSPKESVLLSTGDKTDGKLESKENANLTTGPSDSEENRTSVKETASVANEDSVKRRETKRTSPNFYRHSLAGSLPRPYHGFDASRDNSDRERRGSFQSDTSGDSEAEAQTQGVPSFMRWRAEKPFLKPGFTPVQFNYRPLPESISNRKESWTGQRSASTSEVVVRDNSADCANHAKDLAAESSSDSESGVFSSSTGTSASLEKNRETSEQLSSEERESEVERELGVDKRSDGTFSMSLQLSDAQEHSLRSQNSIGASDCQVPVSNTSTHEEHATSPARATESAETSKGSNVDDDEEKGQANVFDMVGLWNRKSEVIDV